MFDFKELEQDGTDLELLVREILFARGLRVFWSGVGPDRGKDLICEEPGESAFGSKVRRWLVSCKHFAHSGKSVGISDVGEIVDSCADHDADGFLLVCTTRPSSSLAARLESLGAGSRPTIQTFCWDEMHLERFLATPKGWAIAQRFLPVSAAAQDMRIWATESPNRWIGAVRGYYLHVANRISSQADVHLPSIHLILNLIGSVPLASGEELRPRAVYYDDKNGAYMWYLDLLFDADTPSVSAGEVVSALGGDSVVLADGQMHSWDVQTQRVHRASDHYDPDHYRYYTPHLRLYEWGQERPNGI